MGKKSKDKHVSKGEKNPAIYAQPFPKSEQADVWPLVIKDMTDRDRLGRAKYGIPLRIRNGRDALVDAYQEVLDLSVYMRQEIEERRELMEAIEAVKKIPGLEQTSIENIGALLSDLAERIDKQESRIRTLTATVIHYQSQSQYLAGYDDGVESAIEIFETIKGEKITQEGLKQIYSQLDAKRSHADST
jgi:hypothetical protein